MWKDSPHELLIIDKSITSAIYLFLMTTFKFYSLSKFQLCSTVVSTTLIMFYIRPNITSPWWLLFYCMSLIFIFSGSTYQLYHTILFFLFQTCFTKYNALKVHLCCCKWHDWLLSHGWIIFNLYIHSLRNTLRCFHILDIFKD